MEGPVGTPDSVEWMRQNKPALDNSLSIGKTPLVKIKRVIGPAKANVYAKIEGRNPAYSVKCRIGASMIWEAERQGLLKPGMTIVEPTSGNTGIALAFVAASKGYGCILTIPETMSIERRKVMSSFGAKIILTEGAKGMKGAISKAQELYDSDRDAYFMPQQFENSANPLIHRLTTGPEIFEALEGKVDVFVAGVGTGGTITGTSQFLKLDKGLPVRSVAVEPIHSPVLTQSRRGEELKPGPHKIQGIGAGFIPKVLDLSLVDDIQTVTNEEAIEMAQRLSREEGISCGISCGAAMAVAARLAALDENAGKNIVVILPDTGERYLTSALFLDEKFKVLETAKASDAIL